MRQQFSRQDSRQQMRQQNTRQQPVSGSSHHQNSKYSKARCSDKRRNIPTFTLWHKDVTDTVRPSSSARDSALWAD